MRGKPKALPLARVRRRTVQECRAFLDKEPPKKRTKAIKKLRLPKFVTRRTTPEHRLLVVRLRLGGVTFGTISKLTGIHRPTCYEIYRRCMSRKTVMAAKIVGRPVLPLPEDVKEHLLSKLDQDRFMSLRQRMRIIKQKFDFNISFRRLRGFFIRNDIKYRSC